MSQAHAGHVPKPVERSSSRSSISRTQGRREGGTPPPRACSSYQPMQVLLTSRCLVLNSYFKQGLAVAKKPMQVHLSTKCVKTGARLQFLSNPVLQSTDNYYVLKLGYAVPLFVLANAATARVCCTHCALGRFIKRLFWNFNFSRLFLCSLSIDKPMLENTLCSNVPPSD